MGCVLGLSINSAMAMLMLRTFLSTSHGRALEKTGLLDREVEDPLFEERMVRIRPEWQNKICMSLEWCVVGGVWCMVYG